MSVLIVDDHPSFRASARLLLEEDGFEVVGEASDGESAIQQIQTLAPNVVLLDLHLPGIDGFEVARRVSGGDRAPSVILVSSHDGRDFGPEVDACGARGFVPKADLSGERLRALLAG